MIKQTVHEKLDIIENICKELYNLSHHHGNKDEVKKYISQIRKITDEIYVLEWGKKNP